MNATSRSGNEVDRALASVKRALAQLINLLKHPDEAVRAGAADALKGLDPPPTWPLGEALLGSRDRPFRLRIIKVLVALGEVDQVRVVCVLCEAFKERRDLEVKRAVALALLALVPQRSGPSPSPGRASCPPILTSRDGKTRGPGRVVERGVTRRSSSPACTRINADGPGHQVRSAERPDGEPRGARMPSIRAGAIGDGLIRHGPGVPTVRPGGENSCPTCPPTTTGTGGIRFPGPSPRGGVLRIGRRRRRNDRGRLDISSPNVASSIRRSANQRHRFSRPSRPVTQTLEQSRVHVA